MSALAFAAAAAIVSSLTGGMASADASSASSSTTYVTAAMTSSAYDSPRLSAQTVGAVFAGQAYAAECKVATEELPNSWIKITRNEVSGFVPAKAFLNVPALPSC